MVYLVYLLALIFIVLGFLFGVSVGWKCVHGRNAVGNLMIAPGDENEQPYIFLDLTTSIEYLESSEYVVLKVKPLETREKPVRLTEETPNLLIKEKIKMENKTLLNETLESGMESLKTMKPGSEEYAAAVNSLAKLHEMQMNETAEENSKTAKEDELQLKWHQAEADVQKADSDRRIEILKTVGGIAGTLIMGGLFVWNQVNGWFNEEEGHIPLSPTFKEGSRTLMQNIFRK